EAPSMYLPVVASRIITNNVQVAFFAFAFGITAGIGTLLLLTLNGLFFGAVLGLFANYGLAGWLLTFVARHGVLELTAILIGGGGTTTGREARIAAGAADSTVHLSRASRMPRILRESASICFRLVTVSASYLSALSRSSWVSARIAARGFDRSWRSCLMGSSASTI